MSENVALSIMSLSLYTSVYLFKTTISSAVSHAMTLVSAKHSIHMVCVSQQHMVLAAIEILNAQPFLPSPTPTPHCNVIQFLVLLVENCNVLIIMTCPICLVISLFMRICVTISYCAYYVFHHVY